MAEEDNDDALFDAVANEHCRPPQWEWDSLSSSDNLLDRVRDIVSCELERGYVVGCSPKEIAELLKDPCCLCGKEVRL